MFPHIHNAESTLQSTYRVIELDAFLNTTVYWGENLKYIYKYVHNLNGLHFLFIGILQMMFQSIWNPTGSS